MTDTPASVDDSPPERKPSFPIVGVGASAGGLEAFTRLLRALPGDTGMAFVLIQHLTPSRDSALAEILSRATPMPVTEVADEPAVEPDHVYVIPPNRSMLIAQGHLRLFARRVPHHPIDQFFRSLAVEQRHMAIGVILSGTATDGTLGLEEIKAEGGITFAQDDTAQHDGMPRSAVASGAVDFVLPPEGIAEEIARIAAHPLVAPGPQDGRAAARGPGKTELAPVLRHLRAATGVDFTQYKESTLVRRITRRMVLLKKDGIGAYADHLRGDPAEVEALYQDILINVTGFFRDSGMFEVLKGRVIPALLQDRPPDDPLRVWVLGCSTGEEAYSVAMVVSEGLEAANIQTPAQIFATDLNLAGVQRARAGVYSRDRLENVSGERLRRFFVETEASVRVSKRLRDMCVFSRHNLMADPPFSRMDLITCRNLLIYLEPSSQQRIIPILHYALKPRGRLVLGASETVGPFRSLFGVEDVEHKVYVKKSGPGRVPLPPPAPGTAPARSDRSEETRPLAPIAPGLGARNLPKEADRLLLGLAPAAVLVDSNLQVLQFRGRTEPYLAPADGKASLMLLRMARPGLLAPLRGLMLRAKRSGKPVRKERVQVGIGGRARDVDVKVCPVKGPSATENGYLVVFEDSPAPRARGKGGPRRRPAVSKDGRESAAANTVRLEHELAGMRDYVQSLSEQHDAAIEMQQAANEEAQSANEELQSVNEELETSKEEVQSSNEELSTVNDELNSRNLEMGRLNSDLANLITSVQVAIVIVARDLRIRLFSPMAEKLLNIIPADVGRPLSDIRLMIDVPDLQSLMTGVIDSATPTEREVQARDRRWYSLRIRPYESLDNKIDGAVLMMVDVDAVVRAREYAESVLSTVREPILVLDAELRVRRANRSFYEAFNVTREETEGRLVYDLGDHQWDIPELRRLLEELLVKAAVVEDFVVENDFAGIGPRSMQINARRFHIPGEDRESILVAIQDVTERRSAERERARRAERLDASNRSKADFIAVLSHELRTPVNAISGWAAILKRPDVSDEDRRMGVEVIARNSRMQAQLISDLLDSQRIASGRLSLNLRSLDLRAEVEAAIEAAIPSALEKHVLLLKDIDTEGPVVVRADSARLQQVLGNLLANAVKFTPEGGEIRVGLLRKEACAEVIVRDSGQGIDADVLPHVFERFRQYESQAVRVQGSLGLGLAVSRQLVDLHGGSISAESAGKGKGATFTVSLPFVAEALPAIAPEAGTSTTSLQGALVLVVDDDPEAREPVRRVLEEHGAEVLAVKSTDEALEALQQVQPDVLVSDIGMPDRDGYHLIRAIRALPPERGGRMPAVALTAFGTSVDRERTRRAGYASHLVKPVQPSDLIAAVAALLPPPPRMVGRGTNDVEQDSW